MCKMRTSPELPRKSLPYIVLGSYRRGIFVFVFFCFPQMKGKFILRHSPGRHYFCYFSEARRGKGWITHVVWGSGRGMNFCYRTMEIFPTVFFFKDSFKKIWDIHSMKFYIYRHLSPLTEVKNTWLFKRWLLQVNLYWYLHLLSICPIIGCNRMPGGVCLCLARPLEHAIFCFLLPVDLYVHFRRTHSHDLS